MRNSCEYTYLIYIPSIYPFQGFTVMDKIKPKKRWLNYLKIYNLSSFNDWRWTRTDKLHLQTLMVQIMVINLVIAGNPDLISIGLGEESRLQLLELRPMRKISSFLRRMVAPPSAKRTLAPYQRPQDSQCYFLARTNWRCISRRSTYFLNIFPLYQVLPMLNVSIRIN